MKFAKHGGDSCGNSYPVIPDNLERDNLRYAKWIHTYRRKPYHWEGENEIIEIMWYYSILIGRNDIFKIHTNQSFQLHQVDIAPTDNELKSLLTSTHNFLATSFENLRVSEFPMLPSVSPLSDEEIQNAQHRLIESLP